MAVTSDVKLKIYNGALRRLGSRRLSSLSENREPRRVLDDIWGAANDQVLAALEAGEWSFATRAVKAEYDPVIEPDWGFRRAFRKPDDFVRLSALSASEYFRQPLTAEQFTEEAGYWFTDYEVLYIRFVSHDTDYGLNSSLWTQAFRDYLECALAYEACERITDSSDKRALMARDMRAALAQAKSNDAMGEGVKFPPRGNWIMARSGWGRNR